jgi:hypothetical protein
MSTTSIEPRVERLEDLMDALTRNIDRLTQRMDAAHQRMEAADQRSREADERVQQQIQEYREETDRKIAAMNQQTEAAREKSEREWQAYLAEAAQQREVAREKSEREWQAYLAEAAQQREAAREKSEREWQQYRKEANERTEREHRKFRQQLAEISDKHGLLAEDLVAPSIPGVLKDVVRCTSRSYLIGVRVQGRFDGRSQEYDVIARCGEHLLINETKSRLRPEHIPPFLDVLAEVRLFLPEFADKQVIGSLASLYVDPSLVKYGERHGLIILGVVGGLMEVLNSEGFVPTTF